MKIQIHLDPIHLKRIKVYLIFNILLISQLTWAQPTVLGTKAVDGSYQTYNLASVGIFKQYRLQATSSEAVSIRKWEFARGTAASTDYSTNWRPNTEGNTLSSNTFIPTTFDNGARYNTGSGGKEGLLPAITAGNYYTFNVSNNSAANNVMQLLETSYNPVTISAVTQSVGDNGAENITITTSTTPNTAEYVYLRYSTNSYTNSTLVQATGSGTSWSATIPWQASAVSYYVYSSNKTLSEINADVTAYGQNAHDMSTLNLNNNGGSNYSWSFGNIIVKSTGGSAATGAAYSSLTVAGQLFSVLNTGTAHTGAVTVFVCASTTETGATALNHSSNWTSVNMYPINSGIILSGTVAGPLIDLNGADNVTIDGRVNATGTTVSLSISNLSNSNSASTSTIRFINDATDNTVKYCSITGSGTLQSAEATSGTGLIFFSTAGSGNGNDNNTITANNITNAGGNRPANGIYSFGTPAKHNSGLTISNNTMYDLFNASTASRYIYMDDYTSDCSITDNHIYQPTTLAVTTTTSINYRCIHIEGKDDETPNQNFDISNNIIGGSASDHTGTWTKTSSGANGFGVLYLASTTGTNTIDGNTIKNFDCSNTGNARFNGMVFEKSTICNAVVGGIKANTISNMILTNTATGGGLYGISCQSNGNIEIRNTIIDALNTYNASTLATNLHGISSNDTDADFTAIANIISNCTAHSASTIQDQEVVGISKISTVGNQIITGNTISGLSNLSSKINDANKVAGILCNAATIGTNTVSSNFIYLTTAGASGTIFYGIKIASGATVFSNNIIAISGNTPSVMYGIYDLGTIGNTCNLYFNTIHLSGTPSASANSYALYSNALNNTRNYRNNIFVNARTTNGSHYAAYFNYATASCLTLSNNDYYAPGTGGVLGRYNSVDVLTLPLITSLDENSVSSDPSISPGTTPESYKGTVNFDAVTGTGVTTDFLGIPRPATPKMGAWDLGLYKLWKGTTSSDWNTASNWYDSAVPVSGDSIVFLPSPAHHAVLDQNRIVGSFLNNQSTYDLVTNGYKLTIQGALKLSNCGKIDASAASSTIEFAGSAVQTIENTNFKNNTIYNLTIGNAAGVIQNSDITVSNVFTINTGRWYQINAAKALTVIDTVTNLAGVGGLIIKAGNNVTANASFIYPQNQTVQATVEFYSKASWDKSAAAFSRYKWQYFGIPVSVDTHLKASPTFDGAFVRKFNETGVGAGISNSPVKRWLQLTNTSVMTPFAGYEIVQAAATTYSIQGTLVNNDFSSGQLTYSTAVGIDAPGSNIFSNPYTAAIDIQQLTFGAETEAAVYQFHTGSHNDWGTNGTGTQELVGQYIVSPKLTAGDNAGIPRYISSMQGFLIKKLHNDATNLSNFTFSIPYTSVKAKNTTAMRSPEQEKSYTTIDVTGNRFADKVWIFIDPNCSRAYDNGWDGRKILGSVLTPQLLIREAQNDLQISAVDNINNTVLAFQPGEDAAYTLTFKHTNIVYPELYLLDAETNSVTDISATGSTYNFIATASTTPVERFKIVTGSNITTDNADIKTDTKIFSNKNSVFVNNKANCAGTLKLMDITGKMLLTKSIEAGALTSIETGLVAGNYIALFENCERAFRQTILIK